MDHSSLMVSAKIPLWFWKQASAVKSMKSELAAMEFQRSSMSNSAFSSFSNLVEKYRAMQKRVDVQREIVLPLSEQSVQLALSSYAAAKIPFLEVMMALENRLEKQLEYVDLQAETGKMYAEMESLLWIEE